MITFGKTPLLTLVVSMAALACSGEGDSAGEEGDGDGDSSTGGGTASGGAVSTGGGSSSGGSSGGELADLAETVMEGCEARKFAQLAETESAETRLSTSAFIDSSETTVTDDTETLTQSTARTSIEISWPASAMDGDQVAATGWLTFNSSDPKCFSGQLTVRSEINGETYYFLVADELYSSTADGTCGTIPEEGFVIGCYSERTRFN